jgi:hypothetical protein
MVAEARSEPELLGQLVALVFRWRWHMVVMIDAATGGGRPIELVELRRAAASEVGQPRWAARTTAPASEGLTSCL